MFSKTNTIERPRAIGSATNSGRETMTALDVTGQDHISPNRSPLAARRQIRNPKSQFQNLLWFLPLLLAGFCFWHALPAAHRPAQSTATASVQPTAVPKSIAATKRTLVTRPIQEIQVGQRVLADNPELLGQDVPQATIDPENTRLVVLHMVKPDGHELTIETLLPLETLFAATIERLEFDDGAGSAMMPLPLVGSAENVLLNESLIGHIVEMNLPELGAAGPATIISIRPCPAIEPDDGTGRRLVTSVFRHAAANVVDVSVSGSDELIGVTANHPFWSEDRQAFIPAGELLPGENLRRADGKAKHVISVTPRLGPQIPVFNFEVDSQHVYSVGIDGLLVHNNCSLAPYVRPGGGHHIYSKKGFQGAAGYLEDAALAIPKSEIARLKLNHLGAGGITQTQRRLFREMAANGIPNTLKQHTRIAVEALKAGGLAESDARNVVARALKQLRYWGVTAPTTIPWGY